MFKKLVEKKYILARSHADIAPLARKFMNEFFGDLNLPMPYFKVVNNIKSRWLGRTIATRGAASSVIKIQKSVLKDEETFKRVLLHELIHHADFIVNGDKFFSKAYNPHGRFFLDYAEKINQKMGKDYVTKKSDESYVQHYGDKEFYLLIRPHWDDTSQLLLSHSLRLSAKQKEKIVQLVEEKDAKLFKVKDLKFLGTPNIGSRWALPKDSDEKKQIEDLYNSGTEIRKL